MPLIIAAFLAGMLTVLAPCSLSLLPIILGQSAGDKSMKKSLVVIGSLSASIFIFTLLIKVFALFIAIPNKFWAILSGIILIIYALITLFPHVWEKLPFVAKAQASSAQNLQKSSRFEGVWGQIATGFALGPVFSSCSPTYTLIIIQILPVSFGLGLLYLLIYLLGLSSLLIVVAYFGSQATARLKFFANPEGSFKRILGIILLIVGVMILTGFDKAIETALLDYEFLNFTNLELLFLKDLR